MSKEIRQMIDKVKNFEKFVNENVTKKTPLIYVVNKNGEIKGFNLVLHSDKFNSVLYDKDGKSQNYGYGAQINNKKEPIEFDSINQAQRWYNDREEKLLKKETENISYTDLSNIAQQLRKLEDINYQIINRGSCFKFAKEISKLGYGDYTFIFSEEEQEVIHVYVKLNENLYWDATGFHTKSNIKQKYYIGKDNVMYDGDINELNHYCNIDTYDALTTIPISNEVWKKIIKIINLNKK